MSNTARMISLGLLCLLLGTSPAGAAVLADGVFEEALTEQVAAGDPVPVVRLFFDGLQPTGVEKVTEINGDYQYDFYYFYLPEPEDRLSAEFEVSGGLLTTPSLSSSNDPFDWSSRQAVTVNPFIMSVGRYYLLSFTSSAPSRFSGRRADYFYFALRQGSVSPPDPQENRPPSIALLPDPEAADFGFQSNILAGLGFSFVAEDPDGIADLDWSSLTIQVAGVDKTAHFMAVLGRVQSELQALETSLTAFIKPNPAQFMDAHNLFNIQWNGDWPVKLRLCDRGGLCAEIEHTLYFGPFITFQSVRDRRCGTADIPLREALRIESYLLGNIGYAAPIASLYLGIQDTASGQVYSYYSQWGYPALRDELKPMYLLSLPSGFSLRDDYLDLPVSGESVVTDRFILLDAGEYKLLGAVLDQETGAMRMREANVSLCSP